MRMMILAILCLSKTATVTAEVRPRVFLSDANSPLPPVDENYPHIYPEIMVGTKLTIVVDSNEAHWWSGALAIEDPYLDYGELSCRDCNDMIPGCEGSLFPPAGRRAQVQLWENSGVRGYDLYTDVRNILPGDWFVIDYAAARAGICNVGFYDHSVSLNTPIYLLTFSHVPTRDFNGDTIADFDDFSVLASYWQASTCTDPDWCEGTDLDQDQDVDFDDAALFAGFWLEKTEISDVEYCTPANAATD